MRMLNVHKGQGSNSWISRVESPHDVSTMMWPTAWNRNRGKPLTPRPSDLQAVSSSKSWLPPCGAVHASKTGGVPAIQESKISASASQKKRDPSYICEGSLYQLLVSLGFLCAQAAVQVPLCQVLLNTTTDQTCWEHLSQWVTNLQTDLKGKVSWRE